MKNKFCLIILMFILISCSNSEDETKTSESTTKVENEVQDASDAKMPSYKYISVLSVDMRKDTDGSQKVLKNLKLNQKMQILSEDQKNNSEWSQIKVETGEVGWILSKYLSDSKSVNKIFFDDKCLLVNGELFCVGENLRVHPPKNYFSKMDENDFLAYTINEAGTDTDTEVSLTANKKGNFTIESIGFNGFSGVSEYGFSSETTCSEFIEILKKGKLKYIAFNHLNLNPPIYTIFSHGSDLSSPNVLSCQMQGDDLSISLYDKQSAKDRMDFYLKENSDRVYFEESVSTQTNQNNNGDNNVVIRRAEEFRSAWERKDISAVEFIIHNSFKTNSNVNKWDWLKARKKEAAITKSRTISWTNVKSYSSGDKMVVTATQQYIDHFYDGKNFESTHQIQLEFVLYSGEYYLINASGI